MTSAESLQECCCGHTKGEHCYEKGCECGACLAEDGGCDCTLFVDLTIETPEAGGSIRAESLN